MKYLKLLTILLLLPVLTYADFDTSLKYGAKGDKVVELQEFLIDKGFLNSEPTGNFYSLTLKAVKAFQTANNLPSTGYFGLMSRTKANEILALENSAEIEEVGSITPPVDTTVNKQLEDLNKKIEQQNAIIEAQKQTQTQTNVILEQIKTNTNKVMPEPTPIEPTPPIVESLPYFDKSKVTLTGDYQITTDARGVDTVYKLKPGNTYTVKIEFLNNLGQPMIQGREMKITNSVDSELKTKTTGDYTEYEFIAPLKVKGYERFYFVAGEYQATMAFTLDNGNN